MTDDRACAVEGCEEPRYARGMCRAHFDADRYRRRSDPDAESPADERAAWRESWIREWLVFGRSGPLGGEVCPWRARWHLRNGFPVIDHFQDVEEIRRDWEQRRDELLAEFAERKTRPWAAEIFEPEDGSG